MSLASFGAIAGGINQGMDMNRRDEQLKEQLETSRQNRQAMVDQNEYLKEQRERNRKQQARDDQLAEDLANIPAPGQQKGVATDLGPDLKTQTEVGYAREKGLAYQRADKDKEASELFRWANEADSRNAAQNWVRNLYSLPRNASLEEVVRVAGAGVDGDSSPVGVDHKNMRKNDDGSVTVRLYNKLTGASQERTFGSVGDIKEALTWHYAPDYARSLYEKRQAAQDKIDAERAKGVVVPAGATFVPGVGDSRGQYTNNNRLVWNGEYNPDGTPQMVDPRSAGGSASAVGAGKGGKIQDPLKAADDAWEFSSTKGEVKLQPNQLATGLRMTRAMASDGVDPTLAAEVAMEVATDPTKAKLEINGETGTIDLIYRNPRVNGGRSITISKNAGSLKELEESARDGRAGVRSEVQRTMREAYGNNLDRMITIAADPKLSRQYLETARERGMDATAIANRLNLMRTYLAPSATQTAAQTSTPQSQPAPSRPLLDRFRGGLGATTPKGNSQPEDPLEGLGVQQARELRNKLQAEKDGYIRKGQSEPAKARIAEIDKLIKRIQNNQY